MRLFESCTWTKPPNNRHIVSSPITGDAAGIVVQGEPDLGFWRREAESRRHDSEDLPDRTFDFNGAAYDGCVAAKALLPDRVAQDYIVVLSGSIFSPIEGP